jgi:hypothetical protein
MSNTASTRDPETKTVTSVMCGFCRFFGREEKVGQKRKPSSVTKSVKVPFCSALYTQYLEGQRSFKWTEYQVLAAAEKESFFISIVRVVNTLNAHFVGAEDQSFIILTRPKLCHR